MTYTPKTYPELKDQSEEALRQFVREVLLPLQAQGKSLREMAKIVKASYETVRNLIDRYG